MYFFILLHYFYISPSCILELANFKLLIPSTDYSIYSSLGTKLPSNFIKCRTNFSSGEYPILIFNNEIHKYVSLNIFTHSVFFCLLAECLFWPIIKKKTHQIFIIIFNVLLNLDTAYCRLSEFNFILYFNKNLFN